MKKITRIGKSFFLLLLIILLLAFLAGCDDFTPTTYGSIDIKSTPAGAKVYLDWEDTDYITPIVLTNVSPGTHSIKLELYHYKIKEDTNVLVTAGETTYRNWDLTYAPTETKTLQPGSDKGKDTYVIEGYPEQNSGGDTGLVSGYLPDFGSRRHRTYLEFDLSPNPLPAGAVITKTTLALYKYPDSTGTIMNLGVYQVLDSWEESSITWNNQPTFSAQAEDSIIFVNTETWIYWHIDDLVQGWLDGSISNYGIVLKVTDEATNDKSTIFISSDHPDDSLRPKLEIEYYIP